MSYSFRIHILSYKITEFNFYGIFCIIRSIVLINYFGGSEYAEEDLSRNCVQDSDVKHKKRKNNTADRNGRIRIFKETMDVCRKDDYRQYTDESKKAIASCASIAVTIKSILDTPLLTDDGLLTGESETTVNLVQQKIEKMG